MSALRFRPVPSSDDSGNADSLKPAASFDADVDDTRTVIVERQSSALVFSVCLSVLTFVLLLLTIVGGIVFIGSQLSLLSSALLQQSQPVYYGACCAENATVDAVQCSNGVEMLACLATPFTAIPTVFGGNGSVCGDFQCPVPALLECNDVDECAGDEICSCAGKCVPCPGGLDANGRCMKDTCTTAGDCPNGNYVCFENLCQNPCAVTGVGTCGAGEFCFDVLRSDMNPDKDTCVPCQYGHSCCDE